MSTIQVMRLSRVRIVYLNGIKGRAEDQADKVLHVWHSSATI